MREYLRHTEKSLGAKSVMVNNLLQKYRSEVLVELVHENIPDEDDDGLDLEDDSITMEFLVAIIQQLPDRYRMVFNLYVIDGFSHKEIAEMLGITTGTSKSNLARARIILKEKIEAQQSSAKVPSAQ